MLEKMKVLKEFFKENPNFFYNNGNGFQVNHDAFKDRNKKDRK